MNNFVAIDFETANRSRGSVCSVGLVVVENLRIVETVSRLIKPYPNYYERMNVSIHGIRPEMTEHEKTFEELWPELRPYLHNRQVVAHNAPFDMGELRQVLNWYNLEHPNLNYFCSVQISRKVFSGLFNYQLPTVCAYLDIDDLKHHDATSDAIACAKIVIEAFKRTGARNFTELTKLLKISTGNIRPESSDF
jgi:DNA polymerase III subunit epsilon